MGFLKNYFSKKSGSIKETTGKVVGAEQIKSIWQELYVDSFHKIKGSVEDAKNNKGENLSFSEAVSKYNLTPVMLKNQYTKHVVGFYAMSIMFLLIFGLFVFYLTKGYVLPTISSFFVGGAVLSFVVSNSVNAYRLKHKEFRLIKQWFESGEFFPSFNVDVWADEPGKRPTGKNRELANKE